jgi:hypothetical protein
MEIAWIIATGHLDYNWKKNGCFVKSEEYSQDENICEIYENVLECSFELLKNY